MTTGRKLALASALVACAIIYLTYLGAAESWRYYLTVDECLKESSMQSAGRLRVNGKVAGGSLQIAQDRRKAAFILQGVNASLEVQCNCPIPDNLAENMEVVVEGRLGEQHKFQAEKILTRCAGKYDSRSESEADSPVAMSKSETHR